jgi:hypothetical protein
MAVGNALQSVGGAVKLGVEGLKSGVQSIGTSNPFSAIGAAWQSVGGFGGAMKLGRQYFLGQ